MSDRPTFTISIPGAAWGFIEGTSCYQRQFSKGEVLWSADPEANAAAIRLEEALHAAVVRHRGKGWSYQVTADRRALDILWAYMDTCEDGAYYGDGPSAETYAAKTVKQRIEEIKWEDR